MRFARGFRLRGNAPPRNFFKRYNLVRLVYIWFRFCLLKITIFYIEILKIHVEIHINYCCTHMLAALRKFTTYLYYI